VIGPPLLLPFVDVFDQQLVFPLFLRRKEGGGRGGGCRWLMDLVSGNFFGRASQHDSADCRIKFIYDEGRSALSRAAIVG